MVKVRAKFTSKIISEERPMMRKTLLAWAFGFALVGGAAQAADAPAEIKLGTLYASSGRYASISMPVP